MTGLESQVFSRRQAVRRTVSSVLLGIAMTLFTLGLTLLRNRLDGIAFLAWWTVCIVLVTVVVALALIDIREIRRSVRLHTRELLHQHFHDDDFLERLRRAQSKLDQARDEPTDDPPPRDRDADNGKDVSRETDR